MIVSHKNKKEVFSELRNMIFRRDTFENGIKLSSLKNSNIINEVKTLKVIELDDLDSFRSYESYDNYLMFKHKDDYYFCDTQLIPGLENESLIKIVDYKQYLRKDKMKKIQDENTTY